MKKRAFGVLAVILIALMGIVLMADLDGLPHSAKQAADAAVAQVQPVRTQFDQARAGVNQLLAGDPELYRSRADVWKSRIATLDSQLRDTEAESRRLAELRKADRRSDAERVAQAANQLKTHVDQPLSEVQNIRAEAQRWAEYKRNLPKRVEGVRNAHNSLSNFDAQALAPGAAKAMVDWPAKKQDLESRFEALTRIKSHGEQSWSTFDSLQKQSTPDYSQLFATGDQVEGDLKQLQSGTEELNKLASQLYVSRDKVLLELDDKDNQPKEKVRVVETRYKDAALSSPQVASREEWQTAEAGRFDQLKKSIGMVVERKAAGKYDNEAEKTLQAPGYAYIAPPGQANHYGSWNNGVWTWLPQYLLLSQMLRTSSVPPISTYDWYEYERYRRSGTPWYGRSGEYGRTWSGGTSGSSGGSVWGRIRSWGSGTADRGGPSWSDSTRPRKDTWNTGGSTYDESRYKSQGSYGGSRYQSRPSGGGFGGGSFGSRGYSRGGSFSRGGGRGGRR